MVGRPGAKRSKRSRPSTGKVLQVLLGQSLRSARTAKGLSQAQLGAPHFTRAHVSAIELGKIMPSLNTLAFFAQKLDTKLRDLVPDT
jgi:transcriptional regulator with XRE-family HTH domain